MIKFLVTAALAATMATGAIAQAAPANNDDTYAVKIRIGDLDLASKAGQATFRGRILRAADSVCGVMPVGSLAQLEAVDACRQSLMHEAHVQTELALHSADTSIAGTR